MVGSINVSFLGAGKVKMRDCQFVVRNLFGYSGTYLVGRHFSLSLDWFQKNQLPGARSGIFVVEEPSNLIVWVQILASFDCIVDQITGYSR